MTVPTPNGQSPDAVREAVARTLCKLAGRKAGQLEPGDIPYVDGRLPNGDPGHFLWREYLGAARKIIAKHIAPVEAHRDAAIARADEAELEVIQMERGKAAAMGLQQGGAVIIRQLEERIATLTADLAQAKAQVAEQIAERAKAGNVILRLRMAFLVLTESGHGGAIQAVRKWFTDGASGPIPFYCGAVFEAWAAEQGISNVDGFMGYRASITLAEQPHEG